MRLFIGIDLGSTTTKAVVIDEDQNILGRGITNSRSNYDTAAAIAKQEALVNSRFHLFRKALGDTGALNGALDSFLGQLERDFRSEQYLEQLADLKNHLHNIFDKLGVSDRLELALYAIHKGLHLTGEPAQR